MNINGEVLEKGYNIPGVMPVAMEHTGITANFTAVHMGDIISLKNQSHGYIFQKIVNTNHGRGF